MAIPDQAFQRNVQDQKVEIQDLKVEVIRLNSSNNIKGGPQYLDKIQQLPRDHQWPITSPASLEAVENKIAQGDVSIFSQLTFFFFYGKVSCYLKPINIKGIELDNVQCINIFNTYCFVFFN